MLTEFENDLFKFHASIEQSFPDRGEPSIPENKVTLMKAEFAQVTEHKCFKFYCVDVTGEY